MMFITGLIKFLLGLVGILATFVFLAIALFSKNKKGKIRTAGITFFTTATILILITIVEFLIFPINPKTEQIVLTAYREAPIGGIWLTLYNDNTWEMGYSSREISSNGTYIFENDTLTIYATSEEGIINNLKKTSFTFNSNKLIEIENSGIRMLEIKIDKMKKGS